MGLNLGLSQVVYTQGKHPLAVLTRQPLIPVITVRLTSLLETRSPKYSFLSLLCRKHGHSVSE